MGAWDDYRLHLFGPDWRNKVLHAVEDWYDRLMDSLDALFQRPPWRF